MYSQEAPEVFSAPGTQRSMFACEMVQFMFGCEYIDSRDWTFGAPENLQLVKDDSCCLLSMNAWPLRLVDSYDHLFGLFAHIRTTFHTSGIRPHVFLGCLPAI